MIANVLLVSAGVFHPPLFGRFWLRRMLSKLANISIIQVASLEALPQLDMDYFQGLILYYHQRRISESALGSLDDYIRGGGGALAIHSATASFKDAGRYFEILGGRFTSHGPVETYEVMPSQEHAPIFSGLRGFHTNDELYIHALEDDIQVHYHTTYQGESVPVVWTRIHGEGRVCYAGPGHRSATMRLPAYQAILERGLRWVCGRS